MAKEKKIIQVDLKVSPTLEAKTKMNILAEDFPYPEFMDKDLMPPTCLEQLWGDEDSLWKSSNKPTVCY